jgi:hypothetical protein
VTRALLWIAVYVLIVVIGLAIGHVLIGITDAR